MPGGARNYTFTVNNYTGLLDPALWPHATYCIYQEELAPSGTPHLQGYVQFSAKRTLVTVKGLPGLEGAHLEPARGSPASNIAYCSKEDGRLSDSPYIFGEPQLKGQGARTDMEAIADMARAGHSLKRIAETDPSNFIRYSNGIAKLQNLVAPKRGSHKSDTTVCLVFYGAGGTGKSTFARRLAHYLSSDDGCSGEVFSLPTAKGSGTYWDTYDNGDVVIIDEMKGDRMKPTDFNTLIDNGALQVPVHGGFCQFNSKYVIVTTNVSPKQWWPSLQFPRSLQRRITLFPIFRNLAYVDPSSLVRPGFRYEPRLGQFIIDQ